MQITITCELNARNLEILKQLCAEPVGLSAPAVNTAPVAERVPVMPTGTPHPDSFPEPVPEAKQEAMKKITAQDVKAVCLKMSKAGRQAELKAAFAKFGGKKLSDIAEADYEALLKELGDA